RTAAQRLAYSGNVSPVGIAVDGFEYRLQTPEGPSNPCLIAFARAPVVLENDNNDAPETAQELPLPCEVAGRMDKKGDRDWYVMACKKGETNNIELFSERLGAQTMMYIKNRDQAAKTRKEIDSLDDNPETFSPKGINSFTSDSPMYK